MLKRIFKAGGEFPTLAAIRNELSFLGDTAVRSSHMAATEKPTLTATGEKLTRQ